MRTPGNTWKNVFKSVKKICRENKLKEFHVKFVHRIIVTKKKLLRFGFKDDDECLYCGESDSIDHTFIDCQFTKRFTGLKRNSLWFNDSNNTYFSPKMKQILFDITSSEYEKNLNIKFNYTLLYMRHYIYINKLHSKAITLHDFSGKISFKYRIENIS